MTIASDRPQATPTEPPRLRVVLLLDVHDGHEQDFLAAYEQIRHQVADVPGHISDQLCQSLGNAAQWLITSEWESAEPFLRWVDSAAHRKMVEPLHNCVRDTRSLRFVIARETPEQGQVPRRPSGLGARPQLQSTDPVPAPPLSAGGVVHHAITFTVKPGSEQAVAKILADYQSPRAQVDATTRLCRTSLYMQGNRVVRAVEVQGDLANALRHVAAQPEVRAVEEAVNPYLEEERDLTDPTSARAFFARAALPAVQHFATEKTTEDAATPDGTTRYAFCYPVRQGCGEAVAILLAEQDALAAAADGHPLASSTMFLRDGLLVRLVDLRVPWQQAPAAAAGIAPGEESWALRQFLQPGPGADLTTTPGIARFLEDCAMELVTDRQAQDL
ncbi:SchA/CurD-like domain-containing protein [Kitasatospora azatica]|uniref:SchA/CurD-like domain-containing protein n=1 Tax=Kitasatospora azatica TaxID=58347 RepID=UPI00056B0439|nr:SchA/CurD-like domain-containing protein [Kitasatospora azatica]